MPSWEAPSRTHERACAPPPNFDMNRIVYNVRTLSAPLTGVQRYVRELDARLGGDFERVAPSIGAQGASGHLWEQLVLPVRLGGRMLFSPGNTGPVGYRRQVVTIHDASTLDLPDAFAGAFGRWYRWMLPRLARRVLGVVTVSEFSRARIVATLGVPRRRVAVVHNGVTPAPGPLAGDLLSAVRLRYGLHGRFLLFVGSRDARKNAAFLVKAFAASGVRGLELVLVGGGNDRLFAPGEGAWKPGVRVLGHVEDRDLEALYALAEGFVFPSLYEGFGLPPLEAMARGCPVLCSDATCLPEVCGPALERGGAPIYFSPRSEASLAEALSRFAGLPAGVRQQMASAGRARAGGYTWDRCASETLAAVTRFAAEDRRLPGTDGVPHLLGQTGEESR